MGEENRKMGAEKRKMGEENRKMGEENRKMGAENRKMGDENRNCTLGPPYICIYLFFRKFEPITFEICRLIYWPPYYMQVQLLKIFQQKIIS